MELLLIRHGLPVRREVSHGPADPELAPQGHAQADLMTKYLGTERICHGEVINHLRNTGLPMGRFQKG